MIINLPQRFDRDELSGFFSDLDAARDEPEVVVDFSPLTYSFPSAMLVAGSKIREWVTYRSQNGYLSRPAGIDSQRSVHSYLMHLGFFDFIYMDEGNRVDQVRGSIKYLPISRVSIPPFDPYTGNVHEWHKSIFEKSKKLAGILAGSYDDSEELRVYSYSIREVIRNVFEHSGASECFICGQRWWNGRVEIAILDEGVGILNTLKDSHDIHDDLHALKLALTAGVSRTNSLSEQENVFGNSGFGLYVLSNLAASFGWFALGSGAGRVIGYQNTVRLVEKFSFSGTFFGMRLNTQPRNFRAVLNEIIAEGESESGLDGVRRRASGISRVI